MVGAWGARESLKGIERVLFSAGEEKKRERPRNNSFSSTRKKKKALLLMMESGITGRENGKPQLSGKEGLQTKKAFSQLLKIYFWRDK